jgi:hypothetical protein
VQVFVDYEPTTAAVVMVVFGVVSVRKKHTVVKRFPEQ